MQDVVGCVQPLPSLAVTPDTPGLGQPGGQLSSNHKFNHPSQHTE